jgi:hypothetical protein
MATIQTRMVKAGSEMFGDQIQCDRVEVLTSRKIVSKNEYRNLVLNLTYDRQQATQFTTGVEVK